MGDEHVDVEPKELLGQCRQPVVIALRPTELDDEIATFGPAEIAKSGAKRRNTTCVTGRGHQTEEADTSDLRRLRARRKRPCRSAAEQRDELASLQPVGMHPLPWPELQLSGLERIKSGPRRSAGFRSGLGPDWVIFDCPAHRPQGYQRRLLPR